MCQLGTHSVNNTFQFQNDLAILSPPYAASGSQVTSLRQFRVTCQEKAVEIQLRLRSPDANGRVMHFILRRQPRGGCRSHPSRSQKRDPKSLGSCGNAHFAASRVGIFSRMRSKGSRFTLGVWGIELCSPDVVQPSATVRNRSQPSATLRVRTIWPCLW